MTDSKIVPLFGAEKEPPEMSDLEKLCRAREAFETPAWAARAILDVELLPPIVWDPCSGLGALGNAIRAKVQCALLESDIEDWSAHFSHAPAPEMLGDFLKLGRPDLFPAGEDFAVVMNPPFSLACQFVDQALRLGARKVICLQRMAWRESAERRAWWAANPPARIWLCGARATCWRFDVPAQKRGSGSTTAHAFYIWERAHKGAELMHTLWPEGGEVLPELPFGDGEGGEG